jgi:hypothetical protein
VSPLQGSVRGGTGHPGRCPGLVCDGLSGLGFGTDGFGTDGFGTDGFGTDGFGTDGFGTDRSADWVAPTGANSPGQAQRRMPHNATLWRVGNLHERIGRLARPDRGNNKSAQGRAERRMPRSAALG